MMTSVGGSWSVDDHEERLPFFDEVRRELRRVAAADALHRVDRFGRYAGTGMVSRRVLRVR
jgi:hypothetical protein